MALSITRGSRSAFFDTAGLEVNVASTLDAIDPRDVPFLSMLGWGKVAAKDRGAAKGADTLAFPCTETTHTWLNDAVIPNQFPLNGAYATGDGRLNLGTTYIKYINVNDVLMADDVQWIVTAVNDTTGYATTTVLAQTTEAAVAANVIVRILANANQEGKTAEIGGEVPDTAQTSNYVQNFDDRVSVTYTEKAVLRYGIGDNEKRAIAGMIQRTILRLENAAIYNTASAAPAARTDKPRMGGLYHFIRSQTPEKTNQVYSAGGAALTDAMLKTVCRAIYEAGGEPDMMMVSPYQKAVIDSWVLPYVRIDGFTDAKYGAMVSSYRNSFFDGTILMNRWLRDSDVVILTKKYIGIGPLKGHDNLSFTVRQLADRGNTADWYMSGSYTMEVRNNLRAHGWIYGLATS